MSSDRRIAHAPRARALAAEVAGLRGPCIGCSACTGLCQSLIEALVLPDILLAPRADA